MKILLAAALGLVACGKSKTDAPKGPRTQITYSIDLDVAVDERASVLRQDIEAGLADQKLRAAVRTPAMPLGAVTVVPEDPATRQTIEDFVKKTYGDAIEPRACDVADGPHAICAKVSASHAVAIKKAALGNAVKTIRARLEAIEVAHARVAEQGDQIVVSFPANDEQGAQLRDVIARTGKLAFKVVDNNAPFMRQVYAHVGADGSSGDPTDPAAQSAGIRAEVDQWRTDEGSTEVDFYLIAHDREDVVSLEEAKRIGCFAGDAADGQIRCRVSGRMVIDRYLRDLAKSDPRFVIPDDREIGYELVEPYPDAKDRRPFWRSYYLDRTARLTGRDISNAEGTLDPNTSRPIVLLDFGRAGGEKFARLTEEIVGKKLATILDGKIKSAPIIMGPIRGGRASITMGGSDEVRQMIEREELVAVLKTGSLPAPLREESVTTIP